MTSIVQKYIKDKSYGVNQKRPGDQKSPLHLAVKNKNLEIVRALLNQGADIYVTDSTGKTPNDYAHI